MTSVCVFVTLLIWSAAYFAVLRSSLVCMLYDWPGSRPFNVVRLVRLLELQLTAHLSSCGGCIITCVLCMVHFYLLYSFALALSEGC